MVEAQVVSFRDLNGRFPKMGRMNKRVRMSDAWTPSQRVWRAAEKPQNISSGAWRVYVKTANTLPQRLKP